MFNSQELHFKEKKTGKNTPTKSPAWAWKSVQKKLEKKTRGAGCKKNFLFAPNETSQYTAPTGKTEARNKTIFSKGETVQELRKRKRSQK